MNEQLAFRQLREAVAAQDRLQCMQTILTQFGAEATLLLRKKAKKNQRDFAAALGITPFYLSKIENGHMPLTVGIARKMLEVAGEE